jgi:hypothetical protein
MSLSSLFQNKLDTMIKEKEKEKTRHVDRSHCTEFLSTFTKHVTKILDKTTEPFVRIPFPVLCGTEIEKLLHQENIPIHKNVLPYDIEKTNTLFVLFNVNKNRVDIMLEEI